MSINPIDIAASTHPSRAGIVEVHIPRFGTIPLDAEQLETLKTDLKVAGAKAAVLKEQAEEAERKKHPGNGTIVQGKRSGTKRIRIGDGDDGKGLWMALDDFGSYEKYHMMTGDLWHVVEGPFVVVHFEPRG